MFPPKLFLITGFDIYSILTLTRCTCFDSSRTVAHKVVPCLQVEIQVRDRPRCLGSKPRGLRLRDARHARRRALDGLGPGTTAKAARDAGGTGDWNAELG